MGDRAEEPARDVGRRAGIAALTAVAIAGGIGLLVYAAHAVLLVFAGLLVGVALDALARPLARWTRLRHGWALTIVVVLLVGGLSLGGWLVVPRVTQEARGLTEHVPEAWRTALERYGAQQQQPPERRPAQPARGQGQDAGGQGQGGVDPAALVKPVAKTFAVTLRAVANLVVVLVIGIYAAAKPELYVHGAVRLLPPRWRDRALEALQVCGHQLRRWMFGTLLAMVSAATLTGLGLWLLGVEFAAPLALVAGVFELVPNIGPIVAAVPAIVLAAASGQAPWWQVALLYAVVQTFQSYVIQPLTQEKMVEVPPVLLISSLVIAGWLLGTLGMLTAVPLLVVVMVLVRLLWLRDRLGEQVTP